MPSPIGQRSHCCICHEISNPMAPLLCPTRAVLPQTPTPQAHRISMGWALKARDPQTFMISPPLGLHSPVGAPSHGAALPSPAWSLLCWPGSQGLHSPAGALFHWAVLPSPAQSLLCWPRPQSLHSTVQYSLCKAVALRPDLCSALLHPPKPVKPEIHRHAGSPLHQPVPFRHAKPMLQAHYFTSAKGLHWKACGMPPTIHLPQEGSKPT
jgi:hypothetical protein